MWGAPKIATDRIVQIFKSITGREIFRRKLAVKKDLMGRKVLVVWILCRYSR
jgi:hypothetical protein